MKIQFTTVEAFAEFCAVLTTKSIAFNGEQRADDLFIVTITGF